MRSITRLFGAFGTLADSLLSLASVVDTATAKLRLQLASETDALALDHQPATAQGGCAVENSPQEVANPVEPSPSAKRNGRAKATA